MESEVINMCETEYPAADRPVNFPFSMLLKIPSMNYSSIGDIVKSLEDIVSAKNFYENINDYVNPTISFILIYSKSMINDADSGPTLLSLLALLRKIFTGVKSNIGLRLEGTDSNPILSLSMKIIESYHEMGVKVEIAKFLTHLIPMLDVHTESKSEFLLLISRVFAFLDQKQYCFELHCLLYEIFKWRPKLNLEMGEIIKILVSWNYEEYLNQVLITEDELPTVLQILKCLLLYYEIGEVTDYVTTTLKTCLCHLCKYLSYPMLRISAEELLAILIEELYCTRTLVWPGGRHAILKEIQCLSNEYQAWPHLNERIFFVVSYLLVLHSKLLWNSSHLWLSLNNYITSYVVLPEQLMLKALIMLYPVGIDNRCNGHTSRRSSIILLESLGTYKSLSDLLTYHAIQLRWLLSNGNPSIKTLVLVTWLQDQTDDDTILSVLNSTKMGFLLVVIFMNYPDSLISSRILQLMGKLTPETKLERAIEKALPLICARPTIFAQLLQLNPTIPTDKDEILNLIRVASASLPFLAHDSSFEATCYYSVRLMDAMKSQPNALLMFCHYFTSVKVLVAKSAATEDTTSLAAIKLLRRLVNNQATSNVNVGNDTIIHFTSILQGNSVRISCGLKLLQSVLNCGQKLFLKIHKQSLFGTYHLMASLTRQQGTAPYAYQVLTKLILFENSLCFSLATTHSLCLLTQTNMEFQIIVPFLTFLEEWLNIISKHPFIYVPTDKLLNYLSEIRIHHVKPAKEYDHRISHMYQLLHNYNNKQRTWQTLNCSF